MKERPILMSAPMVRALLDGSKTQTRRVMKNPPTWNTEHQPNGWQWNGRHPGEPALSKWPLDSQMARKLTEVAVCPYGQPGDHLWVRENGWERPERTPKMMREGADTWEPYYFDADGLSDQDVADFKAWGFKRRPSIHMPRWASRITLEVTNVRVERLHDISEPDALAEGVETWRAGWDEKTAATAFLHGTQARIKTNEGGIAQRLYYLLSEQINGAGSWDANPWVWVVEFKRINHG